MTTEETKALVRRFVEEVFNKSNAAAVDEFVGPAMIDHSGPPGRPTGREGVREVVTMFASAFPDWYTTIEDVIAEGDKVVMRGVARGTHKGVFMGIPPTGKQVTVPGIHIMRIANGKIVEHWAQSDQLGMLQQLGAIAMSGPATG